MSVYYNDIDSYCCQVLQKNIQRGNLPEGYVDGRDIRDLHASDLMGYQHVHLFAGIGGFPLGLARAGYPLSLRTLTGGFPCQDISNAGKRAGITGTRSGLWKEMYRLIHESLACDSGFDYILIENVAALLHRGLDTVLADLATCGYDAEWTCLRASDFGASHQRERVFIVAYPQSIGRGTWRAEWQSKRQTLPHGTCKNVADTQSTKCQCAGDTWTRWTGLTNICTDVADAASQGPSLRGCTNFATSDTQAGTGMDTQLERCGQGVGLADTYSTGLAVGNRGASQRRSCLPTYGCRTGTTQSGLCRVFNGLSRRMDGYQRWPARPGEAQHEWEPPRAVTEKVPQRVARLKALGNAIVPQCAEYVARCILAYEQRLQEGKIA